jgi:hypothetical protein
LTNEKRSQKSAFADNKASIDTENILRAIKHTHFLSEIMKDALERMKKEQPVENW